MPFKKIVTFFADRENIHAAQRLFCGLTDDLHEIAKKEDAIELLGHFLPKTNTAIKMNIKKLEENK